jgi:two-component system, sensor histidine kinase LadS
MAHRTLILLMFALWSVLLRAEVIVTPSTHSINLARDVSVLKDAPTDVTIEQINTTSWQSRFAAQTVTGTALNLGQVFGVVWLRVNLIVMPEVTRDWVLDIPYGDLSSIEWFVPGKDAAGYAMARNLTPPLSKYRYHAQPIQLEPGPITLYARIQSAGPLTLPLQLQTESDFLAQEGHHLFIQALYFGALATLLLYALLFSWSVRDAAYLVFSAYLLASGLAIFIGNGLARLFLWSTDFVSEQAMQSVAFALAGTFSLWLTSLFLSNERMAAGLKRTLQSLAIVYLLMATGLMISLAIELQTDWLEGLLLVFTLLSAVVVITVLWLARAGKRGETYFLAAWTVVWLGALVAALRVIDWVASNQVTLYVMQISTGAAALLFSVALFVRVRQHYQARLLAQQQALDARTALIQTLQDSERKLEATVLERTGQLQASLDAEKRLREQYVRFGAMISHEFRNPLGVIETQTSLLQREIKAGIDNSDKRIGTVRSAAQRLALLFEKWLQSDRLQNATDKLHTQPIEFDEWFEDLVAKCHAYHANHRIDCSLTKPIGTIYADERLLQIAILNLIDNACKYSPSGTVVHVSALRQVDEIRIDVIDQGVGISDELHAKVFDEYFRVDPNSPVLGVGLGLPFVRKIVTLHGGVVTVSNNPAGQGARFTIVIPINPVR